MTFSAKKLRDAREKAGLTRFGLCLAIDFKVQPQAVWSWEKEGAVPKVEVLLDVARVLGTTIEALMEDDRAKG